MYFEYGQHYANLFCPLLTEVN